MRTMTFKQGIKRTLSISLYGIYHAFIALILTILLSEHPTAFLQALSEHQFPSVLAISGCVIGIYFSMSSCLSLTGRAMSNPDRATNWGWVGFYIAILIQMIWILLPAFLVQHAEGLRSINPFLLLVSVSFCLSIAMSSRRRLYIIGGWI
ncbi:hypothetical protein Lqui_2373 [Legionella quinlivanii]|uniref:Uncharacterized protein n=1 Tax=Legionella quinlivanii TaxID=45073 RepID=A0A0W0XRS0_9GAMM|nr:MULTISPECIES: hypothetical protein [Legionella]KTD47447.1 hypothetical protein Lqui_2373 [Legionella quinlivanii]MCE3043690.1 hypothetical protein [Legionella sp. 16cNR16C]SEG46533.1 hypothetical protein SAMN02746093_03049 [Legionella quinlivanii DSM 21216]STY49832.1 Uncharacterised protein [Legionella quinlivanii]